MCPLSDDALLEWVLSPEEADPAIGRHVAECAACRERSRAVAGEQVLLREAFAAPPTPHLVPVPRPAPLWTRFGVAALLLVTVAVGALLARSAGNVHSRPHRYLHAALAPVQKDLGLVAQKIAAARETLPEAADPKTTTAYLDLLSREEGLYIEGMEHFLGERSPLNAAQEQELRRMVHGFTGAHWGHDNVGDAAKTFREKVRALLSDEQYLAFEEFSRQGMEWQRHTQIELLMEDIADELDLRFSEQEKLRRTLESNYPNPDLPVLLADRCPPDALVDNPTLNGAVRNSLDASYQRKYDTYLGNARAARERALRIVRQIRTPQ